MSFLEEQDIEENKRLEPDISQREKVRPQLSECAPEVKSGNFKIRNGKTEDLLGFFSKGDVYKQDEEPSFRAKSETSTEKIQSRGSNNCPAIEGPGEHTTSCRTCRPLHALPCRKKAALPFSIQRFQRSGAHLVTVAFDWRSTSSCRLHLQGSAPSKLGLFDSAQGGSAPLSVGRLRSANVDF